MIEFFHDAVYQPLYNILIFLYNTIPGRDFGVSIVVFTIILRAALIPIYRKQVESQKKMQEIQPKIKEIQQKYKGDKEKQTKELMKFYKESKTNPFSGCFPMIVQLIFLIAIYRVLINVSTENFIIDAKELYSFIANPETINHMFLRIVDLTKRSIPLAILAAGAQYIQTKMLMKKKPQQEKEDKSKMDFAQIMSKQMLYLAPLLTLFIGIKFAAGLALYWLVSTVFMIIQQAFMARDEKKD